MSVRAAEIIYSLEVGGGYGRDPRIEKLVSVPLSDGFLQDTPFDYGRMDYDEYAWNLHDSMDEVHREGVPLLEWSAIASTYLARKPRKAVDSRFVMPEARRKAADRLEARCRTRQRLNEHNRAVKLAEELMEDSPYRVFDREAVVDAAVVDLVAPLSRSGEPAGAVMDPWEAAASTDTTGD